MAVDVIAVIITIICFIYLSTFEYTGDYTICHLQNLLKAELHLSLSSINHFRYYEKLLFFESSTILPNNLNNLTGISAGSC